MDGGSRKTRTEKQCRLTCPKWMKTWCANLPKISQRYPPLALGRGFKNTFTQTGKALNCGYAIKMQSESVITFDFIEESVKKRLGLCVDGDGAGDAQRGLEI